MFAFKAEILLASNSSTSMKKKWSMFLHVSWMPPRIRCWNSHMAVKVADYRILVPQSQVTVSQVCIQPHPDNAKCELTAIVEVHSQVGRDVP